MSKSRILLAVCLALVVTTGAGAASAAIPPDADHAKDVLAKSPRHGEWVDVALPDGTKLVTWVVFPEKKKKSGVVIVIHEIFGLSDWVRAQGRYRAWASDVSRPDFSGP